MCVLAFSVYTFSRDKPVGHPFKRGHQDISNIQFKRSFIGLFTQTNDYFGYLVTDAVVSYASDNKKPLMMLLADPGRVDEAAELLEHKAVRTEGSTFFGCMFSGWLAEETISPSEEPLRA